MSANNQTLIKEHKGKWYVFGNVMAESWVHYDHDTKTFDDKRINELPLKSAFGAYESLGQAQTAAQKLEEEDDTEYGICYETLLKDDADVKIIDEPLNDKER